MRRARLLVVVPLVLALGACGGTKHRQSLTTGPSPACVASGQGTTDLATKPVVPKPTGPAPAQTTTYDVVCGSGPAVKTGDQVTVKYVGVLYADGTEFDSTWKASPTQTFGFTVGGGVIPGFSKGVTGMQVGGRREVVIPAADGYGANGTGPIPPGATLIFVIDLVKIG